MGALPLLATLLGLSMPGRTLLGQGTDYSNPAARGSSTVSLSATADPIPSSSTRSTDTISEDRGRRIFSTAFVRIGPDGHLSVRYHDGRELVLRDVTMRAKAFCGRLASGEAMGKVYCGNYADVAAAQPGSGELHLSEHSDADDPALDRQAGPKMSR